MGKVALIAGASGLVGGELLKLLLAGSEYERVVAIVRSPLTVSHPKLSVEQVDFGDLSSHRECFAVDDVFCCLGTTIRQAKTKEAMFKVDVEYPLEIARLGYEQGARQFLLVSSMNANSGSPIWYARIKGQLEEKICVIPFETTAILRPSLLLGKRAKFRLGEGFAGLIAKGLPFLFSGALQRYKPIEGRSVAAAMYVIALRIKQGVTLYSSKELARISERK